MALTKQEKGPDTSQTRLLSEPKSDKIDKRGSVPIIFVEDCSILMYSTVRSQHNTDFAKTNQNEVVRIRMNFFEYVRVRKLIRENELVILNL